MQENAWENEDEEVSRRSDLSNNSNLTPTFPPPLATWAKIAKGGIFCWVRSFQVRIICMCSLFLRFAAGSYSLGVELRVDGASQSEDDLALLNLESTSLAMGGGGGLPLLPRMLRSSSKPLDIWSFVCGRLSSPAGPPLVLLIVRTTTYFDHG